MDFNFNYEVTLDLLNRFKEVDAISKQIQKKIGNKTYDNVKSVMICFHCISPKYFPNAEQYYTGYVLNRRYIKSKKRLEFTVRIKYQDIENADSLLSEIITALKGTVSSINELAIPKFHFEDLLKDIFYCLESSNQTVEEVDDRIKENFPKERKKYPNNILMGINHFWEMIDSSKKEKCLKDSIQYLVFQLSKLSIQEQYGFELRLRKLLEESNHHNVLGLAKVILGEVSDDSFLYFRCRLILLGKENYKKAIQHPDAWDSDISEKFFGEELLSVADHAFFLNQGENSHAESPREYAMEFIDYDSDDQEILGKPWNDDD